LCNCNNKNISK